MSVRTTVTALFVTAGFVAVSPVLAAEPPVVPGIIPNANELYHEGGAGNPGLALLGTSVTSSGTGIYTNGIQTPPRMVPDVAGGIIPNVNELYHEGDWTLRTEGPKLAEKHAENRMFQARFGNGKNQTNITDKYLPLHRPWPEMTAVEMHNMINDGAIKRLDFLDNLTAGMIYKMPYGLWVGFEDYYHDNDMLFSPEYTVEHNLLTPQERGNLLERLLKKYETPQKAASDYNSMNLTLMSLGGD